MLALPSVSLSLCLCFGGVTRCRREGGWDGQLQWSTVKSRLWLMNRGALPSHWADFTSSHNHLSLSPTCLSIQHLSLFVSVLLCLLFPTFCLHLGLFFFASDLLPSIMHPSLMLCLFSPSSSLYSPCPESLHICSFWDKKNNPEPWNKLDPTYQYKVTIPWLHSVQLPAWTFHLYQPKNNLDKNGIFSLINQFISLKIFHSSFVLKPPQNRY